MTYDENDLPEFMEAEKQKESALEEAKDWDEKFFPDTVTENKKILEEYLKLCEENFVTPIIFLPPVTEVYKKNFNPKILQEFYEIIDDICKKFPTAGFLDGWRLGKIFSDSDFRDGTHMNVLGAKKFSKIFNTLISKLKQS